MRIYGLSHHGLGRVSHSRFRIGTGLVTSSWRLVVALLWGLGGFPGCGDVTGPVPIHDPSQIYARLELSYHAITLSLIPGLDTMTLQVTARTPSGAVFVPMDSSVVSPVTFRVNNNATAVRVTQQGTLTAQTATSRVQVIATQTIGSVTLADTAVIAITGLTTPTPAIASISVQPLPGDSAKVDCSGRYTGTVRARVFDAAGAPLAITVSTMYRSSDPAIATVSTTGDVNGQRPGTVTLSADAYYYGHGVRDSVRYTIGDRLVGAIWVLSRTVLGSPTPLSYASPADMVIGVGGTVSWMNGSEDSVDIVFDDPTAALPTVGGRGFIWSSGLKNLVNFDECLANLGGNIPAFPPGAPTFIGTIKFGTPITCTNTGARVFPRAGTYIYRSTLTGITGRVVVR